MYLIQTVNRYHHIFKVRQTLIQRYTQPIFKCIIYLYDGKLKIGTFNTQFLSEIKIGFNKEAIMSCL